MSEEQVNEVEEQEQPAEENVSEDSDNPIFNALFKAVEEEEPKEEETEEEFTPPSSLHGALHDIEAGATSEPKQEEEPAEQKEEPAVEAKEPIKKKRVARKKNIVDPNPEAEAPRAAPTSKPPVAQENISDLNASEKERYNLAKWASQNVKGYKNKDKEYLAFFRNHKRYIEKRLKEDPETNLTEDEEYQQFLLSNRPIFNVQDVQNRKIQTQAEQKAIEKLQPEIDKQQKEIQRIQNAPKARQEKTDSRRIVSKAVPEEIMNGFKSDPNYTKTHALESKIVDKVLGDAYAMIDAFHDISNDMVDYDENIPTHAALARWIDNEQNAFIQTGKTKRNGKVFIRRERFPQLSEAEQQKYYTFSDKDIINLLAHRAKQSMTTQIEKTLKDLEASGFSRSQAVQKKTETPSTQPSPPRHNPSPRPGPAAPQAEAKPSENKVLSLLGM